jgi:hypothetical protein
VLNDPLVFGLTSSSTADVSIQHGDQPRRTVHVSRDAGGDGEIEGQGRAEALPGQDDVVDRLGANGIVGHHGAPQFGRGLAAGKAQRRWRAWAVPTANPEGDPCARCPRWSQIPTTSEESRG